jgi:hypothetical protein
LVSLPTKGSKFLSCEESLNDLFTVKYGWEIQIFCSESDLAPFVGAKIKISSEIKPPLA